MDALTRILTPLFAVGAFDRKDYGTKDSDVRSAAHTKANVQMAQASTVLLKNEGKILPLATNKAMRIGVVGDATNVKGGGSGKFWYLTCWLITSQSIHYGKM